MAEIPLSFWIGAGSVALIVLFLVFRRGKGASKADYAFKRQIGSNEKDASEELDSAAGILRRARERLREYLSDD